MTHAPGAGGDSAHALDRLAARRAGCPAAGAVRPLLLCAVALLVLGTGSAGAETAVDLGDRIVIDGSSLEFTEGEAVFGFNEEANADEESSSDSEWGANNDLNQIKITWDASNLYVAVDAVIWDNNVILWLDVTDRSPATGADDGLVAMTEVNSWRRNFVFDNAFTPDLFLATWDGNTTPQIWTYVGANNVSQVNVDAFSTVATFSQGSRGRAMEAAIPWPILLGAANTQLAFDPAVGDSVYTIPAASDTLWIAAAVTAGADGTGGPDSAPDNFTGHTIESSDQVTIDNFAVVPLDADGDGFPDFGVEPRERIAFLARPPIVGIRFEIQTVSVLRPIIAPERGEALEFRIQLTPEAPPDEAFRRIAVSSEIWNAAGDRVRVLYQDDVRSAAQPGRPELDRWDGRDTHGALAAGGIYILRVVVEPDIFRAKVAFAVAR